MKKTLHTIKNFTIAASIILIGAFANILQAQTIYVNSSTGNDATGNGTSGNPYKTFNKGYTMASAGNTIDLTGTFTWTDANETGDATTSGYTIAKNITIQGQGAGATFVQANSAANTADRAVFTITSAMTLKKITLRNGKTNSGYGGIYISTTSTVNINNCSFESNYGFSAVPHCGGAIRLATDANVSISATSFKNNYAECGYYVGGAIEFVQGVHLVINSCTFDNNEGKDNNSSSLTDYAHAAGAIYSFRMNYIDILNSTFVNNHVNTGGGAINNGSGLYRFSLTNVTMAGNSATAGAGGIYNYDASSGSLTYYFKNNLIANNSGSVKSDVYVTGVTMNNNGYNLVENSNYTFNATGDITGDQANLFGTGLSSTPILGDHGTLNKTQTIELLSGSVAINAGASGVNGDISVPTTDQRGMNRNGTVEIGAYEYGGTSGTTSWTGGASTTSWATTGNWSGGVVPNSGYDVTIPGSLSYYPVIDDTYTASNPASCMNLTIENGASVTINPGKAFTVNGTLTNSGGNPGIIIQSSADGTGSLIHNSDDIAATVKTYITGSTTLTANKYHFVSIPTQYAGPTSNLFLGSYLYKLDPLQQIDPPTNPAYGKWVSLGNSTSTELNTNLGYMIYYPETSKTYSFEGNLNNGTFYYPLTGHSGTEVYTFNLIPNPYPSPLIWNTADATKWTKSTGIGGSCYVWNAGTGNYSTIASEASSYLPVGQAFIILVTNDIAPTMSVVNAARTHSSQVFYKSVSETENQLVIKAISNNYADETVLKFTNEASEGFDLQTDGTKLFGLEEAPQLYTLSGNEKFSINNMPLFQDQQTNDMNFETQFTGQVTLSFEGIESFDPSLSIFLKDELTNQTINLRNQQVYTFNHKPENAANRFKLVFGGTIGIEENNATACNLWISGNTLYIAAPKLSGQTGLVEVYNASGQKLMSKSIVLNELSAMELNYNGFIIVKLTAGNEVMTVKGFLRK